MRNRSNLGRRWTSRRGQDVHDRFEADRWRGRDRANRRVALEVLEPRLLLDGMSIPASTFARFEGQIDAPGDSAAFTINIDPQDFSFTRDTGILGFHVFSDSGLDPAAVRIRDDGGALVMPRYAASDVGQTAGSMVHADLGTGLFTLEVTGDGDTSGAFHLDVALLGDINGDRMVDLGDREAMRDLFRSQGYSTSADANRDGVLTSSDYLVLLRNVGDSTTVQPLLIELALTPAPDVLPDGSLVAAAPALRIDGTVVNHAALLVTLVQTFDGVVAPQNAVAGADGGFQFDVDLEPGANQIEVTATNDFGQSFVHVTEIDLVSDELPTIGILVPEDGAEVLAGAVIPVSVEVAAPAGVDRVELRSGDVLEIDGEAPFEFDFEVPVDPGEIALRVTVFDTQGRSAGDTVNLTVLEDDAAPMVMFVSPADGGSIAAGARRTVRVFASDDARVAEVELSVDGSRVGSDAEAPFEFPFTAPSELGPITFSATATDPSGNTSIATAIVEVVADSEPPTAMISAAGTQSTSTDYIDVVFSEPVIDFTPSSYELSVVGGPNDGQRVEIPSVEELNDRTARVNLGNVLANGDYRFDIGASVTDLAGNPLSDPRSFDFTIARPVRITQFDPLHGEEMVSVTRDVIVRFDGPVDPETVDAESFYVIANGVRLPGRIRVSSTEQFMTFFPDDAFDPSTEVRIVVEASDSIMGRDGLAIDPDGDGNPGGTAVADFRTLPLRRIAGTNVTGFVFDSYNVNPDGSDRPVIGATIRVDDFPEANVVTDENGFFILVDMPAPEFFIHIDGSTATNAPEGTSYPNVGKRFHSVAGVETPLSMNGEPFHIYLPPVASEDMQSLSQTEMTEVGFGPAGKAELAAMFPDLDPATFELLSATFAPGAAMDDQGNVATEATILPVPPDRIPAPLPPMLAPPLVISVQTPGASSFDVPVPISFPNLEGLAPGEKSLILSFDHAAGEWVFAANGTVSADGSMLVSDPGEGLRAPGWHTPDP